MKANFVCICGEADDSADPQVCSAPCRGRRLCRPLRFLRPQAHAANFLCTDTAITNKGVLFRQLKSDRQKGRPDKTVPFLRRYVMAVSEQTASFSSISFPTHGKRYGRRRHVGNDPDETTTENKNQIANQRSRLRSGKKSAQRIRSIAWRCFVLSRLFPPHSAPCKYCSSQLCSASMRMLLARP